MDRSERHLRSPEKKEKYYGSYGNSKCHGSKRKLFVPKLVLIMACDKLDELVSSQFIATRVETSEDDFAGGLLRHPPVPQSPDGLRSQP